MMLRRRTKGLRKSLSQCHFAHQKTRIDWTGQKPGLHSEKPTINLLTYGNACHVAWDRGLISGFGDPGNGTLGATRTLWLLLDHLSKLDSV
jgi:hypothetical protein